MRDSEEMGYAIYLAERKFLEERGFTNGANSWDNLDEVVQGLYVTGANAALEWLFEHGRISQYINHEQLEQASTEFRAYLEKEEPKHARYNGANRD